MWTSWPVLVWKLGWRESPLSGLSPVTQSFSGSLLLLLPHLSTSRVLLLGLKTRTLLNARGHDKMREGNKGRGRETPERVGREGKTDMAGWERLTASDLSALMQEYDGCARRLNIGFSVYDLIADVTLKRLNQIQSLQSFLAQLGGITVNWSMFSIRYQHNTQDYMQQSLLLRPRSRAGEGY